MSHNVTVLMPVGPNYTLEWLKEAIKSVFEQTYPVNELLLIDDAAGLDLDVIFPGLKEGTFRWYGSNKHKDLYCYNDPFSLPLISLFCNFWRLGFSASFNEAVGLSDNELMVYLASDDKLMPDAVADCVETWEQNNRQDAWYAMTYTSNTEKTSDIPINAAMIVRGLWEFLGGYPPSAFAGPDAQALSCLMAHAPEKIVRVKPGKINYWIREHEGQETHSSASYFLTAMDIIRNLETARFKPNPSWVENL